MTKPTSVRIKYLVVPVVLVCAVTVGFFTLEWAPRATERMATDSEACASCHQDADEHLTGHEDLACQACHQIPEDTRLDLAVAEFRGLDEVPVHGAVAGGDCRSCHEADEAAWRRQLQTPGHRAHIGEGVDCASCHTGMIHGGDIEPNCAGCHEDLTVHGDVGEGDCITCHGFRVEEDAALPEGALLSEELLALAPWTAQLGVDQVHGAGDCRTCHNPHQSAEAEVDCVSCHRGVLAADVASGPTGHQDCASCHQPHPPRDAPAVTCLECHRPPVPGQRRARASESLWAPNAGRDAGPEVDPTTLTHDAECGTCHTPHVFEADPLGCPECHEPEEAGVARTVGHDACLQCHEPHSPPPGATSCIDCHRAVGHGGAPAEHRSCLGCHNAHAGAPDVEDTCARCHEEVRAATAAGPTEHASCESCHSTHGDPTAGSTAACADCHRTEAQAATGRRSPEAHRQCAACHTAHEFANTASCASCHGDESRASATWPSGGVHAGPCAGCHSSHEAATIPTCRSCHAEQNTRAHIGGHENCATCHQVHQAFPGGVEPWRSACASCHEEEARAGRNAPGDHAACRNCHEPVGQRPPRCGSCHEAVTQTLMHRVSDHQRCADCHRDHSVARPGRDTCIGCHEEMAAEHFPDAETCQNCHPFGR